MPAQSAAPAIPARSPRWIQGTDAELMFLREVNSRSAKAGDRIRLRANTPVLVDGVEVIPVGASAWGEVISARGHQCRRRERTAQSSAAPRRYAMGPCRSWGHERDGRGNETIAAQPGNECLRFPMTERGACLKPLASRRPAPGPGHLRGRRRLVQKYQPLGIFTHAWLSIKSPAEARMSDIIASALAGQRGRPICEGAAEPVRSTRCNNFTA